MSGGAAVDLRSRAFSAEGPAVLEDEEAAGGAAADVGRGFRAGVGEKELLIFRWAAWEGSATFAATLAVWGWRGRATLTRVGRLVLLGPGWEAFGIYSRGTVRKGLEMGGDNVAWSVNQPALGVS